MDDSFAIMPQSSFFGTGTDRIFSKTSLWRSSYSRFSGSYVRVQTSEYNCLQKTQIFKPRLDKSRNIQILGKNGLGNKRILWPMAWIIKDLLV